jgi:predicted regulator of Ras-like GTPase activity (Roadblock/LC7/MglB family)
MCPTTEHGHRADAPPNAADDIGGDLVALLEQFLKDVPGAEIAMLVSDDGLCLRAAGAEQDDTDRLAALGAPLHSLGLAIGPARARASTSTLRQAVLETETERLFAVRAAAGTLLVTVTKLDADAGAVGHEMQTLIRRVRPHLVTPARLAAAPVPGSEW